MDSLALLRLEAETIWGLDGDGLGDGTLSVTALSYDGHVGHLRGGSRLEADRPLRTTVARCWVLDVAAAVQAPAGLRFVDRAGDLSPPTGWSQPDWDALLTGEAGPWVALADADRVVSLAHCARLTPLAAEVGVRTEQAWQRRGLAPLVVRAWAERLQGTGRTLFYSALEDNLPSHRVAAACAARPIGLLARVFHQPRT